MGRLPSSRLAAAVLLTLCLALPVRGEEGGLVPTPDPHQPSLLELLQRVFVPQGGPEAGAARTTPRGVLLPPRPAAGAGAEEGAAAPPAAAAEAPPPALPEAAAGEEAVARPLVEPDFRERELEALPKALPEVPAEPLPPPGGTGVPAVAPAPVPAASATPKLRQERRGYAFGHPRILAQQTLFGTAHGIALLSRACALLPGHEELAREAYAAWQERNRGRIDAAEAELARYYFTPPHEQVRRLDLLQALQLKSDLGLATEGRELEAACATLPQALAKPRYDLELQWLLKGDVERLRRATETRELAAQCRQQAEAEEAERLDAALAAWEKDNAEAADEARRRLVQDMAAQPDPRQPQQAVDGEAVMQKWQGELRRGVGRHLAYGAAEACPGLAVALAAPAHALAHAFDAE